MNASPPEHPAEPILSVSDLSVRFGGVISLNQVSFEVMDQSVCAIIGPNGAGKTTFFNCLSRLVNYRADAIRFRGVRLGERQPSEIAGLGIGRTFQNLALFGSLSVIENIMLGAHSHLRSSVVANALSFRSARAEERQVREEAWRCAEMVGLHHVAGQQAADLPFGFQKRIELARALATRPRLLLLDEPAAGLIHEEINELAELIARLRQALGLTVLMVEHHMEFTMKLCEKIVVLNFGRKIAEGTPADVQAHPDVVSAYLGVV